MDKDSLLEHENLLFCRETSSCISAIKLGQCMAPLHYLLKQLMAPAKQSALAMDYPHTKAGGYGLPSYLYVGFAKLSTH